MASTSLGTFARKNSLINLDILLIITAVVAYAGALNLNFSLDDFSNIETYIHKDWATIATLPAYNRFPLFTLIVYPILLWLPPWAAHAIIIATHTLTAVLIFRLLQWFAIDNRTAVIAATLFLIWPAHAEALFWVVCSTVVFGSALVVAGANQLTRNHTIAGVALVCAGMTFSEGIFFPGCFLIAAILWRQSLGWQKTVLIGGCIIGFYGVFQLVRKLISVSQNITQYPIGLQNALQNVQDLVKMSLGLASSRDAGWLWSFETSATDVGLRLPIPFIIPAAIVAGAVLLAIYRQKTAELLDTNPAVKKYALGKTCLVLLTGYSSALIIFAFVSGPYVQMQSRYTYTSVAYLTALAAVIAGALMNRQPRSIAIIGHVLISLLLVWSIYRTWSNVWANWQPASRLTEQIIRDVRQTYDERHVNRIILVNETKAVGSAYSISRYWAFFSVGRLYISPDVVLDSENIAVALRSDEYQAGEQFSTQPCVFLGWKNGARVVDSRALDPYNGLVLNCETGYVEAAPDATRLPLTFLYDSQASQANYQDMLPAAP